MNKKVRNLVAQITFIIAVIVLWQVLYNQGIWPEILFPSVGTIGESFIEAFAEKGLGDMIIHSLGLLLKGLIMGIVLALVLSSLAVISEIFYAIYNMIVSMFDLIPGVALMPLVILWAGIGDGAILFMVVHSVLWPMSRSVIDGFNAVPKLHLEVGQNIGLSSVRLVFGVFLPAALPRIFSGIKVGWARAWRGLISAEMIFGGGGALGIGYFINDRRTQYDLPGVFATIIVIVIIGTIVEYGIFKTIENRTFKKWGMTR